MGLFNRARRAFTEAMLPPMYEGGDDSRPIAQQAVDAIMRHGDMPSSRELLADLVARHAAGLLAPITDGRAKIDKDLLLVHANVLAWVYPRAVDLFADADEQWCYEALTDAASTLMTGPMLDHVAKRYPAMLALVNEAIEVTRL